MRITACLLVTNCLFASTAAAENWPDFRGPGGDGQAAESRVPLKWSESLNITWKTAIPHRGWSSPVVWGKQIWLTTAREDGTQLFAVCVDRQTGEIVHRIKVFDVENPEPINKVNTYASPSPVIEAGRVYVHFGTNGTACLDTETGAKLWERRDLKLDHKEGPGASPILAGGRLVIHCDGMDVQYIIALDKQTGKTAWKTDRSFDLSPFRDDFRKAYATPVLVDVDGQSQVISTAAQCAYGYDLSSGREIWRLPYKGFSNVSRAVSARGMLFLNTGFIRSQLWAVRLSGGSGELNESRVAWKYTRSVPTKPSVLLVDGLIYMVSDKGGVATCLDAKSGEQVWTGRLGGNFSASPIHAAGRIYFFDDAGKTTVIATGREYKVLAVNELDDGFMASPAVSADALLLRTRTHLYRIEELPAGRRASKDRG